jgi:hypothetical protein
MAHHQHSIKVDHQGVHLKKIESTKSFEGEWKMGGKQTVANQRKSKEKEWNPQVGKIKSKIKIYYFIKEIKVEDQTTEISNKCTEMTGTFVGQNNNNNLLTKNAGIHFAEQQYLTPEMHHSVESNANNQQQEFLKQS